MTRVAELRAAATRLRSTPTHYAEAVAQARLLAALLNARAPLADLLERMADIADRVSLDYKIPALDAALTVARTINTGTAPATPALVTAQHAAIRDDERHRIAAHLRARAKAIEDSRGENQDWLAEQLATHLPVLPIGGAIQDDPRTIAIEAYRAIAFIITAEIPPTPHTTEAPQTALSATETRAHPENNPPN